MKRRDFIFKTGGLMALLSLHELQTYASGFSSTDRMPALFVGHGSPMNAIEENSYSKQWQQLGKSLPLPSAILCISAHWITHGTYVTAMDKPKTIHDFGGFPQELFQVQYPAPGKPALATEISSSISLTKVGLDLDWGLDHGSWSIIRKMYPDATIPVLEMSIDWDKPAQFHYELGKELNALRKKGVLIIGSGNMIHNLGMIAWDKIGQEGYGYDWANELNAKFVNLVENRRYSDLIDYQKLGQAAKWAIPTPDHYYPLLYTLGMSEKADETFIFNNECIGGSLSMTSVIIK